MDNNSNYQNLFITLLLLLFFAVPSFAQKSFKPKALVIRVTKDASTLQYLTQINQRTPAVPVKLVVDVGGNSLWVDCDKGYTSSTYRPVRCAAAECTLAGSGRASCGDCFLVHKPGCNNNTCALIPDNTVISHATTGELTSDLLAVHSTNGFNPGRTVAVPHFLFTCGATFLLEGLAKGATGMAGLGRAKIGLPSLFASAFGFPRKFAICLSSSSSPNSAGVVFFGDGPYVFLPNVDASKNLQFTPLLINPVSTSSAFSQGDPSNEYFIGVKSIAIDGKAVRGLNASLLAIDRDGKGGTKISTVVPYTVLEHSIFKAVTKAFVHAAAARGITRVAKVAPFEVCFSGKNVGSTRLGAAVPTVEIVMKNAVVWRIFGANSMVDVHGDGSVLCLGFVNGSKKVDTSVVIGGYQLENNLVQFDLAASRLGFSSLLYGRQTTCANFNFTSTATLHRDSLEFLI